MNKEKVVKEAEFAIKQAEEVKRDTTSLIMEIKIDCGNCVIFDKQLNGSLRGTTGTLPECINSKMMKICGWKKQ